MTNKKNQNKRLQIMYTFMTNFETLSTKVKDMALSGDNNAYMRAESICNHVATIVYDVHQPEKLISNIECIAIDGKLIPLKEALIDIIKKDEVGIIPLIETQYETLLNVLLLRDTINPSDFDAVDETLESFEAKSIIREDPGIPITGSDLQVLNTLASATIGKGEYLRDYAKKFRMPAIKEAITRLYYQHPYYFEQAFSNTSVNIQVVILEIIAESLKGNSKNKDKSKAYEALKDLHILSTIDTSANKMTSIVSDHQAFEMFITVLKKNNNDYLLNKLVKDNIIMATLFNISSMDKDSFYALRRMFTSARHPFDSMILGKFREIKQVEDRHFEEIIHELSKDSLFKAAYKNHLKTERTNELIKEIKKHIENMTGPILTGETTYGICHILDEFTKTEVYNYDVLTVKVMMKTLIHIYGYIIKHKAYGTYDTVEKSLTTFFCHRVNSSLHTTRLNYVDYGGESSFGITHIDLWYDINCIVHQLKFEEVKKVFLNYDEGEVYCFEIGSDFEVISNKEMNQDKSNKYSYKFNCANDTSTGFEQYVFNLYGRFIKSFMLEHINTRVGAIKKTTFKKTEIPGLSVADDQRVKKGVIDYLTLQYLWYKDINLFLYVYKTRVGGILKALTTMKVSGSQMKPFVTIDINPWVMDLFNNKGVAQKLLTELERYKKGARDQLYLTHGETFFTMAKGPKLKD